MFILNIFMPEAKFHIHVLLINEEVIIYTFR